MGGGESKNSLLLKHGGLLSEAERETLRAVFSNIAGDSEASTISSQQFKVIFYYRSLLRFLVHFSVFYSYTYLLIRNYTALQNLNI